MITKHLSLYAHNNQVIVKIGHNMDVCATRPLLDRSMSPELSFEGRGLRSCRLLLVSELCNAPIRGSRAGRKGSDRGGVEQRRQSVLRYWVVCGGRMSKHRELAKLKTWKTEAQLPLELRSMRRERLVSSPHVHASSPMPDLVARLQL